MAGRDVGGRRPSRRKNDPGMRPGGVHPAPRRRPSAGRSPGSWGLMAVSIDSNMVSSSRWAMTEPAVQGKPSGLETDWCGCRSPVVDDERDRRRLGQDFRHGCPYSLSAEFTVGVALECIPERLRTVDRSGRVRISPARQPPKTARSGSLTGRRRAKPRGCARTAPGVLSGPPPGTTYYTR